eukprot:gene6401-7667_t
MHYSARFHRSNTDQREVAQDVLLRGRNVLMLGGAGTGKSDTIQLVRDLWTARESSDRARALGSAVVASPIGCAAARHEDGCTLDALFAVGALQNHDACVSRYAARLRQVDLRGKKRARRADEECPIARVRQMGLLVVEEAQGGEADQVIVDCDRLFDARLFYVALTRCRSLDGLSLRRFTNIPNMSQLPEAKLYANLRKKTKTMGRAYDCTVDGDLQELITSEVN